MPLDPALVGHETVKALHTITAADVRQFADGIGDPNPLFRDTAHARALAFPAELATPTFVTRFRVPFHEAGLDPERSQVLHVEQEYQYSRPLHVGDQVEVWHRVASVRQSRRADGMAIMTLETLGHFPDGEHVFTGRATVIVRDAAPGAGADTAADRERPARAATTPEGTAIGPLQKHVIQDQVDAYADASGDHNPIHINPAAARAVGLDGTIAHGMLSMAFLGQVATDWLAERPTPGAWLARLRVRFQAMVRPGDTLTCRGVLTGPAENGRQPLQLWAENQHGERVTAGDAEAVLAAS